MSSQNPELVQRNIRTQIELAESKKISERESQLKKLVLTCRKIEKKEGTEAAIEFSSICVAHLRKYEGNIEVVYDMMAGLYPNYFPENNSKYKIKED